MEDLGDNYGFNVTVGANGMCHYKGTEFGINSSILYFEEDGKKQESLSQGKIPLEYIAKDENERTINYIVPKENFPLTCNYHGCGAYFDFNSEIKKLEGHSDELKQWFYLGD